MARYIDADKLIEEMSVNVLPRDAQHLFLAMRGMVRNAPTADVVEVRRCRECKYYVASYCTRDIKGRTNMFYMQPYDFCSYGVRRNDE